MSFLDWIYRVIGNESDAPLAIDAEAEEPVAYFMEPIVHRKEES